MKATENPSHWEEGEITHRSMQWSDYSRHIEGMTFFDPHIHMTSRTTDDYQAMARAGITGIIEPAFWVGQPRTGLSTFKDYYSSLVGWERFRSSQYGIRHYCTIGLNSKEANNESLAEQVMEILPSYIYKEGVVGIGEIGFDDQTPAEEKYFRLQLELAKESGLPVQIHTPHRDKKNGTKRSVDICLEHGLDPSHVIVDHNNEETVKYVLDHGFWAAFTIYPFTKMGNQRMVKVAQQYGSDRIMVNSAADWGISDPLAVPKTAALMKMGGIADADIRKVTCSNAIEAFSKSGQVSALDLVRPEASANFNGNNIWRGGQQPGNTKDSLLIQ